MSRSFDNLNAVKKETTLEKKKNSVFSKLFKFRTLQTPSRKKTKKEKSKKGSNRSSIADEVKDRESALTNSISMPEIAREFPLAICMYTYYIHVHACTCIMYMYMHVHVLFFG